MKKDDERPSILVVDDSRVVRVSVTRILDHGFNVFQANDGQSGLERARRLKPDLVVTDINMPKLDGYGLICALRGDDDDKLSNVPTIVMTGAEENDVRERAYACGANAFIPKPFDSSTLLESVKKHLAHHDASTAELDAIYGDRIESVIINDVEIPEQAD